MATDMEVPEWVQPNIFENVLKQSFDGFVKIKSFKIKPGTAYGDNYSAILFRVNIVVELEDREEKSVSYMLKLPHKSDALEGNHCFEIENTMYEKVIPSLESIYHNVGVEVTFGPKSFKLKDAESDYVLMEDLAPMGFANTKRIEGMDQSHTEAALRKIAQWHAASMVYVETAGKFPDEIGSTSFTVGMSANYIKCLEKYAGIEEYIEKIKETESNIPQLCEKLSLSNPNNINVLYHGDLWCNNIMFSNDSFGNIKDVLLVDFAASRYGCVSKDLYVLLMSSTKYEDKISKFDHYVKFYHDHLLENLKILNYPKPIPTLHKLHTTLLQNWLWGYLAPKYLMTLVLVDPPVNPTTLENDTDSEPDLNKMDYLNPLYMKHMKIILPWLINRGALDGI